MWRYCCEVFDYLSLGAVVDGKVFCVHGGLSPNVQSLDQVSWPVSCSLGGGGGGGGKKGYVAVGELGKRRGGVEGFQGKRRGRGRIEAEDSGHATQWRARVS